MRKPISDLSLRRRGKILIEVKLVVWFSAVTLSESIIEWTQNAYHTIGKLDLASWALEHLAMEHFGQESG